ncbi:MAG: hypothetical protein RR350_07215 [Oscillibacter sp.]
MVKGGWYYCPVCHRKIHKVAPDSVSYGLPFYCKPCKQEFFPTIWKGRELGDDEPFPMEDPAI